MRQTGQMGNSCALHNAVLVRKLDAVKPKRRDCQSSFKVAGKPCQRIDKSLYYKYIHFPCKLQYKIY